MVHHYAGEIVYATEGFLEKNRDMLHQEGIDLLRSSSSEFIRSFGDRYACIVSCRVELLPRMKVVKASSLCDAFEVGKVFVF